MPTETLPWKKTMPDNQWKNRLSKAATVIGNILVVVSIFFIVRIIFNMGISREILDTIITQWPTLFFAIFLWVVYVFISAFGWNKILNFLEGKAIPYADVSDIYVKANIGKFVPGNVMHLVGRNIIGTRYNISQANMALSTMLEIGLSLLSAVFYAVLFSGGNLWVLFEHINLKIMVTAAAVLAVLGIAAVYLLRKKLLEILQQVFLPFSMKKLRDLLVILLIYFPNYLLMGSIFYLTARYACSMDSTLTMMSMIGIFLISWLAGYITPGASGGVGVREIILLTLLTPFYPRQSVLTVIVIHRLITTAGDIAAYFLILAVGKARSVR